MRKPTLLVASALSVAVALTTYPVSAMQHEGTKADNSEMNKQEGKGMTAEQQKENDADRELTRKIRRAIVKDKSLSMTAHNVKIITRGGKVTLKGPVKSEKEKQQVEKIASQAAGGKVTNQLKVAPKKDKDAEKAKEQQKKQKEEAKEQQEKAQEEQEKAKEKQ